jgi:DNA-binding LacI/PurR family transcriptional regulator
MREEGPGTEPAVAGADGARPAVMADVARVACVSHQTVSRVLNDHPSVAAGTRARVLAAVEELGYRRNSAARTLVTRRSQTLGVVGSETSLYGPASTLIGVEHAARLAGYFVSIVSLPEGEPASIRMALDRLIDQAVEGIVLAAPEARSADVIRALPGGIPVVAVQGGPRGLPIVGIDQELGARLATEHLLSLGHDTVRHVAGPRRWLEAHDRVAGWQAALEEAGREPDPLIFGDWSAASGHAAGVTLARTRGVTAVFVANDQMALGLLRAFHEHGIRVPDDVAVVGYDDIPEAEYFSPPLTTVRQNFGELGRAGIALLLDLIESEGAREPGSAEVLAPTLVVRRSTSGG